MSLINTEIKPFKATAFHNGKFVPVTNDTLKGKWSVVVFYPADFTFVCPTELGDLADNYAEFKKLGVEIYGVSTDTHFAHKAWHDTSDTIVKVQYPLVGDPTATLARNFEVLIEEVEAMENVKDIARCSDRLEALIFGMGDYSGSQGIDTREIGGAGGYPGDIFHYARFRVTAAARAAGIDAVDGPFANFKNEEGYRAEAQKARALGMVGKWAIHPLQIAPALDVFTPSPKDVARARKMEAAYKAAEAEGLGAVQVDGVMIDVAVLRLVRNTLNKADLIGM